MSEKALSLSDLSAVLRVDGANLIWRVTRGRARDGFRAGHMDKYGYIVLQFDRHYLQAHRVVWLLTRGEWPASMLDHIDGRRENNTATNLRLATNSQNQQNRKNVGTVEFKGVAIHKQTGKFQAQCGETYLGLYVDPVAAALAYDAEAARRYGAFARLNFGVAP